jgi:uracil-DNA glycosylase
LRNIFKELQSDLGVVREDGDLSDWASEGVLLLNTALTVAPGQAGAHARLGWDRLARQVLHRLDDRPRAALLWGRHAQQAGQALARPGHLRIQTAHPSPLSAHRGFFGSRPFSTVNRWLTDRGDRPIRWA